MPLALDPNQTVPYSLETDRDLPVESRPEFLFRFLTCRDTLALEKLLDKAGESKVQAETFDALKEAVNLALKGTKNLPADFTLDVLTPSELWELAFASVRATRIAEADRKNSRSQSGLATAGAASTTEAASV